MLLAYQSLGVVYGDLSISPLYVYTSTFAEDIEHSETNEEIFGALSFVFWTLTLVPLFKYVFVVLRADDNGEGKHLNEHEGSPCAASTLFDGFLAWLCRGYICSIFLDL